MQFKNSKLLAISVILMLILVLTPISTYGMSTSETSEECYGFIIPVTSSQSNNLQMEISNLINELLRNDIQVYWITNQIYVSSKTFEENSIVENNYFEKGSFLIPFINTSSENNKISSIVFHYKNNSIIEPFLLMEDISNLQVYKLNEPRIAYHNGPWMMNYPYFSHLVKGGFTNYDFLTWDEIPEKLNNEDFNVFIWGATIATPKAIYFTISEHFKHTQAISKIREFVGEGGGFVGSCIASHEISLLSRLPHNKLKPYFPNIPSYITLSFSECKGTLAQLGGTSTITVEILDDDSPISFGLPKYIKSHLAGGVVHTDSSGNTRTIGILKDIEESSSSNIINFIRNIWMKKTIGKSIWVTTDFGKGKVVTFGDHPEYAQGDYINPDGSISRVGNHSRIAYNAVFYATSEGPYNIDINQDLYYSDLDINDYSEEDVPCENNPPKKPYLQLYLTSTIIRPGQTLFFITNSTDPDDDLFYYKFYLGDNSSWDNVTDINFPCASGQIMACYYSYKNTGTYYFKVQAIDIHGAESQLSDPIKIVVTKTPLTSRILKR